MSVGTLWTTLDFYKGKRIRAAAAFAGLQLDIPDDYVHFQDNKKPEFTSKFPHGKIPSFEGKDGFKLFETSAIAAYISALAPNSTLLGSDIKEAALIGQWNSLVDNEIDSNLVFINQLLNGSLIPYAKPLHTALYDRHVRALKTVEQHLSTRTFLVTERITLADITLASVIKRAVTITIDAALRKEIPHIIRHLETVVNQPKLKEIFGDIEYIDKAKQYTPPPKEKKEPKPAPPPAPKAEKKPKPAEEDDEEDDILKEEPKAKNPLEFLPKSTFNLEDWKRAYSNKETRGAGGAIEWFYQNFDKEGFSVWRVDYKYPEELTLVFMSSNLITGFFNRLEASRKYLFGSVGVLGENNKSVISGTFILRGQDAKPVVDAAPDWESYEYKKLDLANEADKTFFEAALAWDLEIDGKKWVDGKAFK